MMTLPTNTVSKLYYFDNRIKSFYEKNGYTNIPFDSNKIQKMIEDSHLELNKLFFKIWGSHMGYHLLDKFYGFRGNVYEFFMSLDNKNRELLTGKDW